jgi:sterol 3beta-glucosyltransferase
MKITLLAYGSRGDVQPYVALGLALKSRGHQARVAAPENFQSFVEAFGLDYAPLAGDTRQLLEGGEALREMRRGSNRGFFMAVRRSMEPIRQRFEDSVLKASQGSEFLLSSPVTEFLTRSAAEAVGAQAVLSFLAPQLPSTQFPSFAFPFTNLFLPQLNRFSHWAMEFGWWHIARRDVNDARRRWGLKPWTGAPAAAWRKEGGLNLLGFSPHVFPKPSDWPGNYSVTGAWSLGQSAAGAGPRPQGDENDPGFVQWLEDGPPPVYFGFGSMPVPHHEDFMELAASVCEDLGLRALIGAGWTQISTQACDLPDNLAIVEQADHQWLFPQCAAIMHHGGAGTTHAALSSGVPNIVGSFFADQPFWGRQVERLGAGRHLPFKKINESSLKAALLDVLGEGTQDRASELGQKLKSEEGCLQACLALENLEASLKKH